jgi:hypothetical protein
VTIWGPDENRVVEAIAALLDLFPRYPGEDDAALSERMARWAIQQGSNVRWEAVVYASGEMIVARGSGLHFPELGDVGLRALHTFNEMRWGGM